MKGKKLILFLISVLILFVSCGGGTSESAKKEAILNYAISSDIPTMNSLVASDEVSFVVLGNTMEGLFQVDKDGNVIPGMAESEEVSADGKVYTFHLRDAKWSDGQPVTAKDFEFAWKKLGDVNTGAEYGFMLENAGILNAGPIVKGEKSPEELGVKAVDDKTLVVTLERQVPFFKTLLTFPSFLPVREDFYTEKGDQYALTPEATIANGPFKLVTWNQGSSYTIMKNENYYDADKVKLDGVNFQIIKDSQSSLVAYQQGEVDFTGLSGELAAMYKDDKELLTYPRGSSFYLQFNFKKAELQNTNLRKAIANSIDKEAITNGIEKNGSQPTDYLVPKGIAVSPNGVDFRDEEVGYTKVDKNKGKEYFELAKKELGKDKITLELITGDTDMAKQIAEFLKSELEGNLEGFTLELKQIPFKERLRLQKTREFDITYAGWGADYGDPMTYLDLWTKNSPYNYGSYDNPEYDKVIYEATLGNLASNPEKRWEELKRIEKVFLDDAAIVPIDEAYAAALLKSNVTGIEFHTIGVSKIFKNVVKEVK